MLTITETACRSDIGTFNFITYTASMNKERFKVTLRAGGGHVGVLDQS